MIFFVHIRMSYYQLAKDKLLEKAKNTFHCEGRKEKSTKY